MGNLSSILGGSASLSTKYAIGEIVDFAGVPSFYDAGDSKWMQGNTWFSGSLLTQALRDLLGATPEFVTLSDYDQLIWQNAAWSVWYEQPKVGNTTVLPTTSGNVLVVNPDGARVVATGLSGSFTEVVSDGTNFYAFAGGGGSQFASSHIKKSADGLTWASVAGVSIPAGFSWTSYRYKYHNDAGDTAQGHQAGYLGSSGSGGVFYLGSKFLWLGWDAASNAKALTSSDCATWTDVTASLFGSATPSGQSFHIHRNGNSVSFSFGSAYKYSLDGGATWSNSSGGAGNINNNVFLQKNSTTASKLIISYTENIFLVSSNGGQTWTDRYSSIGAVSTNFSAGVAYKGSTILTCSSSGGVLARSADDGATWAPVVLPVGVYGTPARVMTDGTNFYVQTTANQLLVSSDGITWTIRALPAKFVGTITSMALIDPQLIVGCAYDRSVFSIDGGVTWKAGTLRSPTGNATSAVVKVSAGATNYAVFGSSSANATGGAVVSAAVFSAGGSLFRATTSDLNPIRSGATAMIRVA